MMKKVMMRGLPVLLAAALLGACATSTPQDPTVPTVRTASCDVVCLPDPRNPCNWPWTCDDPCTGEPDAAQMLSGVVYWADRAAEMDEPPLKPPIAPRDLGRIRCRGPECLLRTLADNEGVQVCLVKDPVPCTRLREIYLWAGETHELANTAPPDETPEQKAERFEEVERRWHTVATDLDIFPSKTPPQTDG